MGGGISSSKITKTVVVLGAAYGGAHAAQVIAAGLPEGWTLYLIDRNTHANHVYVMPRYAVLPGHEYKSFIPYTNVFLVNPPKPKQHVFLHAHVVSLRPNSVTLSRSFPEIGINSTTVAFDYAVYALGSQLPPPLDLWGSTANGVKYTGEKIEGCAWFKEKQKFIKPVSSVLVVGGGALGIQFATDIKSVYPEKQVTLLHSREKLLPRFDQRMHDETLKTCNDLGIDVILGERLDLTSLENGQPKNGKARTVTGRVITTELLLLCTGQAVNTGILEKMDPATVSKTTRLVHVLRTMQVHNTLVNVPSLETEASEVECTAAAYPNIFAVGDVADAFGAIAAGHNACSQAEIAGKNILQLIKQKEDAGSTSGLGTFPLENYKAGPPAIKVSLGLTHAIYQSGPVVATKDDGVPDLGAALIWPFFGISVKSDEDMKV